MSKRILALDFATKTGWAYADAEACADWPMLPQQPVPSRLLGGVKNLGPVDIHRPGKLMAWVSDLCLWPGVDAIYYEAPLIHAHKGADQTRLAFNYDGVLRALGYSRSILTVAVSVSSVRAPFIGRVKGRREVKQAVMERCRARFPQVDLVDDNHADALAVLDYAVSVEVLALRGRAA